MSEHSCLYIVVRGDISPGRQIAQACHAARQFAAQYREIEEAWFRSSNTLAVLAVESLRALDAIHRQAQKLGLRSALFHEADLAGEPTAIALEPGWISQKLCEKLPLAPGHC